MIGVDMPADSHNPVWLTANARGNMEGVADFKETIAVADTMFPDNLAINPHLYKYSAAEMIKTAAHCPGVPLARPPEHHYFNSKRVRPEDIAAEIFDRSAPEVQEEPNPEPFSH